MSKSLSKVLQQSSLHVLLIVVSKALARSGYGDVQILDRRTSKQRSRYGGHDLQCDTKIGNMPGKIIVKVVRDTIRVRMLDELAGAVLRTKADMGMIVSPFPLTTTATAKLADYSSSRVSVISGYDLSELLVSAGVGVDDAGKVDRNYFESLEGFADQVRVFISKNRL